MALQQMQPGGDLPSLCFSGTAGDIIQVDDGDLKVQVTDIVSPTVVRGKALNPHTLREMALVHVKGAFKHEEQVLSARDRVDIRFAAQNQVTFVSVPFVRSAADVLAVSQRGQGTTSPCRDCRHACMV